MKRDGILNESVIRLIGSLGHTDRFVVADAGLPVPKGVEKIDLAVVKGIPGFVDVFKPIMEEMAAEKLIVSIDIVEKNPGILKEIENLCKEIPIEFVEHVKFKELTQNTKAVVRTGECTPYANVIIQAGVNFAI